MFGLLRGLAVGAGAMYFLDPVRGKRRRALVSDQVTSLTTRTGTFFDKALRDAQHRLEGTLAEASSLLHQEPVSDDVLVQRVRSKIGRYVAHPRALSVSAQDGCVVLSGAVLEEEIPGLLRAVWGVRGVKEVQDQTTPRSPDEQVPELQGGRARAGSRPDLLQANWSPATRLCMGGIGTFLMLNCLARRDAVSTLLGTGGLGLVLASMANCQASGSGRTGDRGDEQDFASEPSTSLAQSSAYGNVPMEF